MRVVILCCLSSNERGISCSTVLACATCIHVVVHIMCMMLCLSAALRPSCLDRLLCSNMVLSDVQQRYNVLDRVRHVQLVQCTCNDLSLAWVCCSTYVPASSVQHVMTDVLPGVSLCMLSVAASIQYRNSWAALCPRELATKSTAVCTQLAGT